MRVTTVRATSSKGAAGRDIRKVKVSLENVQGRTLKFRLIWIAQSQGRRTYGAHRVVDVEYDMDGEFFHQEIFYSRSQNGAQYKGFAARLVDEGGGVTLAETAILQPFLRFLNEAEQAE
jgi:hypothetical protein